MKKILFYLLIITSILALYLTGTMNIIFHVLALALLLCYLYKNQYSIYFYSLIFIICVFDPTCCIYIPFFYNENIIYVILGSIFLIFINPQYIIYYFVYYSILSLILFYEKKLLLLTNNLNLKRDLIKEENISLHNLQNKLLLMQRENILNSINEERNRISLEIHDHSGHIIASSIMQISALKTKETDEKKIQILQNVQDSLQIAIKKIREILHNEFIANSIENELKKICNFYPKFKISLIVNIKNELNQQIINHLSSITKEAFTNCVKHSNADKIDISINEYEKYYVYSFRDNGTIFKDTPTGIGLYSMEIRANKMNAKITITKNYDIYLRIPKGENYENIVC